MPELQWDELDFLECLETVPEVDPFAGSGTTGEVALDLGLKAILIEPSATYRDALTDRLKTLNRMLVF